jgi:RNA-directed DNA polymerase
MVRYADDLVVGFQHETDARRFWDDMRERLRAFSLTLHPEKTRLIELAALRRRTARDAG